MNVDLDLQNKKIIIISGPSGVGKNTVVDGILARGLSLKKVITCTTREPRNEERDRVDYYFLTQEEFEDNIQTGEMIEHEQTHNIFYGTTRTELENIIKDNKTPLFVIDIKGGLNWKKNFQEQVITIFITAESAQELENRIRNRQDSHMTEEKIATRIETAHKELQLADQYDYQVINKQGQIEECINEVENIIKQELGLK